ESDEHSIPPMLDSFDARSASARSGPGSAGSPPDRHPVSGPSRSDGRVGAGGVVRGGAPTLRARLIPWISASPPRATPATPIYLSDSPGRIPPDTGPQPSRKSPMAKHRIFTTSVASVYPHYVTKAEKKGRTK